MVLTPCGCVIVYCLCGVQVLSLRVQWLHCFTCWQLVRTRCVASVRRSTDRICPTWWTCWQPSLSLPLSSTSRFTAAYLLACWHCKSVTWTPVCVASHCVLFQQTAVCFPNDAAFRTNFIDTPLNGSFWNFNTWCVSASSRNLKEIFWIFPPPPKKKIGGPKTHTFTFHITYISVPLGCIICLVAAAAIMLSCPWVCQHFWYF